MSATLASSSTFWSIGLPYSHSVILFIRMLYTVSHAYLAALKYQLEKHVVRVLTYQHPCGYPCHILKQDMLIRGWASDWSKKNKDWHCDLAMYADHVDGENDCRRNSVSILDNSII